MSRSDASPYFSRLSPLEVGGQWRTLRVIPDEGRTWPVETIVMAVSEERRVRSSDGRSVTEPVTELAAWPILVAPTSTRRADK